MYPGGHAPGSQCTAKRIFPIRLYSGSPIRLLVSAKSILLAACPEMCFDLVINLIAKWGTVPRRNRKLRLDRAPRTSAAELERLPIP